MTESKTPPLVSIITPCWNDARFVTECIESVLSQDYPHVEHVIQDGASTDGATDVIRAYAQKFPRRIKAASEPDRGQSDGLNKALLRARGDILLVLNADDALRPNAVSWAVKAFTAYPREAVIYGDGFITDEKSNIVRTFVASPYDFEKLLCIELVIPAQAAFIKRKSLEQVGFYADSTLDTCPDYEMWVRIGMHFSMKHVPGFVTKYRRHVRPLDSKAKRTAARFVHSKKLVMDRVFDAPRSPAHIKKLRARAYGGLYLWAAATEVGGNGGSLFNLRAIRFLITSGRSHKVGIVAKMYIYAAALLAKFRAHVSLFTKRALRRTLASLLAAAPRRILLMLARGKSTDDVSHTLTAIEEKGIEERTIREKWKKLVCECIVARNARHAHRSP